MSRFSSAMSAGFALAAVLAGDRELSAVANSVSEEDRVRIRAQSALAENVDRAVLVAGLLRQVRPALALPATLPARLAGLLADHLPRVSARAPEGALRQQARSVLARAAHGRAGFEPERALIPRLLRIARDSAARASQPRPRSRERSEQP